MFFETSSIDTNTTDTFKQIPNFLDEKHRNDTIEYFNQINYGIFTATVTSIEGNVFFVIILSLIFFFLKLILISF